MRIAPLKAGSCAAAVVAAISCGSGGANRGRRANANSDGAQNNPVTITVAKSEARDVPATIDATGTLVAAETSDVAPKIAGKISNVYVNVGQFVLGGATIAKVDDRDARLQLATAQAAVNAAKQSNQAIVSAQANVESAQTQVAEAQKAIADTVIRAPFAGYISSRPVAVGEYVSSASIVATILRTNPIKAKIQVAEADVPTATVGRGVSIEVDAYKDRKFAGTVSAVNPAVDSNSRSAIVEALVSNDDNALRTGMFVTAKITREGGARAVFVPKAAVAADPTTNSYKVFVIQDGVAKLRVVQLGTEESDSYQIVTGVEADETVATSGLDQLYEGAKVVF